MSTFIADANLIIRFLANDDAAQSPTAIQIMRNVNDGKINLFIPDIILMEICWTLKKAYQYNQKEISEILIHLCGSEGIMIESSYIVEALGLYGDKNVDLADALLALRSRNQNIPIITWNEKDFKKLSCEFFRPENITQ